MRNNFFLFALLLLVLSCNKIPSTPTLDVIEEEKEVFKVFHSHFAENTKTVYSFATNGALLADWGKNDRAGVYQTSSNDGQISASTRANEKPLTAVQEGPHSDFNGKPQEGKNHYIAIYPFIENATESYIITQRLQNQIQSGNDNISHLSNHYVYKTAPFTYNDDDIEWNNNVVTTLKIEVPGSLLPIEEVSVRGPWEQGDLFRWGAVCGCKERAGRNCGFILNNENYVINLFFKKIVVFLKKVLTLRKI